MKRFKSKRKKKFSLKILLSVIIILISIIYIYKLSNRKIEYSNEEFILNILKNNNHYIEDKTQNNYLNKTLKFLFKIDLTKPKSVLESFFHYKQAYNEETDPDPVVTEYIKDPISTQVKSPLIYIYNTHQLESYVKVDDNITPNVLMASYLLKGLLNKENIETIVEEANITDFLSLNGWDYKSSYKASRYYIKSTIEKYPDLKLIIDLHRDSLEKEKSTVTINGKSYAKILFVIGTDYDTYENNYEVADKLNNIIKNKYPELSRGIVTKGGDGVDGVYNQDLNSNIILIECGGNNNTIAEVTNTIILLKDAIVEYIGEYYG